MQDPEMFGFRRNKDYFIGGYTCQVLGVLPGGIAERDKLWCRREDGCFWYKEGVGWL